MFLKRLEIQGFKSFPTKVKLDFKEGITAIVGPNGSGKSNISDAIRWVIGEQSAKNLRGQTMEDVIFMGTKNRKSLGFAEVSITLDNSDKKLNIDFDEVCITRKVYRSGESSYFINGASCRLRDVQELFMDTGIGKEGYSIIGQGKIDAILNNKSEDRRALFEEAVGIVKFKSRKLQAEHKLGETQKNLTRTNDIIAEIEKHLEPLKEQAEKTKTYLSLSENLKEVRLNLFVHQYKIYEDEISGVEKNLQEILEYINTVNDEKENNLALQAKLKDEFNEKELELERLSSSFNDISELINKNQNEISINLNSSKFIQDEIKRLQLESENAKLSISDKKTQLTDLENSLAIQKDEHNLKNYLLEDIQKEFQSDSLKLDENSDFINQFNLEISQKTKSLNELKEKLVEIDLFKSQFKEREKQQLDSLNFNKSLREKRQARKVNLEGKLFHLEEKEDQIKASISHSNAEMDDIVFKNEDILREKEKIVSEISSIKSRKEILTQLEKDFDGYNNSVKAVLKEMQNGTFKGVYGDVAKVISVPKKFETAIEIALGSYLQNIITETEEDAKAVIEYLKKSNKGRATFLPISSIKPKTLTHMKDELFKENGFLGVASEVITFSHKYFNVISNLLGRVLIFEDLESAIIFSRKFKNTYKIVTVSGDVINPSGSLTGGSIFKKESSIFSRTREIKEIEERILNLNQEFQKYEQKYNENNQKLTQLNDFLNTENLNLQNIHIDKAQINTKLHENYTYLQELESKISSQEYEIKKHNEHFTEYDNNFDEYNYKIQSLNSEIEDLKRKIEKFQAENQEYINLNAQKNKKIGELKIEINSVYHQINRSQDEIFRLNSEIEDAENYKRNIYINIDENTRKLDEIIFKNKELSKDVLKFESDYKNVKESYEFIQKQKAILDKKIKESTDEYITITDKISNAKSEKIHTEAKLQNIQESIKHLSNSIWESYEITYASAFQKFFDPESDFEKLKISEKDFKNKINSLGQVNVLAVDEYNSLLERYNLNVTQRDDILKSSQNLREIIHNLMEEMEIQFKEQFNLINQNFSYVFSQIFGGGTAKLVLVDKENVLTSGIEIVASPPGKSLQSLSLLSGGERTLTAVSLLFAILKLKPSPFCILDETEAALDDANVLRYANFLKEFAKENQFIVITHKVGTMEVADILYGITMEEQGVSKLISVELNDVNE